MASKKLYQYQVMSDSIGVHIVEDTSWKSAVKQVLEKLYGYDMYSVSLLKGSPDPRKLYDGLIVFCSNVGSTAGFYFICRKK